MKVYELLDGQGGVRKIPRPQALDLIYRHKHRDGKARVGGKRCVLVYRAGTCLVELDDLSHAEVSRDLPYAVKKEDERLASKAAAKAAGSAE